MLSVLYSWVVWSRIDDFLESIQCGTVPAYSAGCPISAASYAIATRPSFYPSLDKVRSYATWLFRNGVLQAIVGIVSKWVLVVSYVGYVGSVINFILFLVTFFSSSDEKKVMNEIREKMTAYKAWAGKRMPSLQLATSSSV